MTPYRDAPPRAALDVSGALGRLACRVGLHGRCGVAAFGGWLKLPQGPRIGSAYVLTNVAVLCRRCGETVADEVRAARHDDLELLLRLLGRTWRDGSVILRLSYS